jgi:hypothetical protein
MKKLVLTFKGYDRFDRPVYSTPAGSLCVDVNPREGFNPEICAKCNNKFEGEPDFRVKNDNLEFVPKRVTW